MLQSENPGKVNLPRSLLVRLDPLVSILPSLFGLRRQLDHHGTHMTFPHGYLEPRHLKKLFPHEDTFHEHSRFWGAFQTKTLDSLFFALKPNMILIQETMCSFSQALTLFSKLKPSLEFCAINATGLSGGLLSG